MQRILVIRAGAMGDTLMLAPALHRASGRYGITLLGREPGIFFLKPLVRECIDYDTGGWHNLFLKNRRRISLPEADLVVSFQSDPDGNMKDFLSSCFDVPWFLFPPFPGEEKIHVALYLARCLRESGLAIHMEKLLEEARMKPLLEGPESPETAGRAVFLHPGSGGRKKNYPPGFWLEVLKAGYMDLFSKKVLILGPAEEELVRYFERKIGKNEADIVFSPQKRKLISLLREAGTYIGHDSGLTHLSAMLGTPTIALFKETDPVLWSPLGPAVEVISGIRSFKEAHERIRKAISNICRPE